MRHGEAETFGLSGFVVRVLADDDHLHLVERTEVECSKYLFSGRIAGPLTIFVTDEFCERLEIRFFELVGKDFTPRCFNLYHTYALR